MVWNLFMVLSHGIIKIVCSSIVWVFWWNHKYINNDLEVAHPQSGSSFTWFLVELELTMLVFLERGKPEYPEKNLLEQRREPTTNSTHICCRRQGSNPGHIGERRVLSPLRHALLMWCDYTNDTSLEVLSHGTIKIVYSCDFWVCCWNPMVWPFKWNLFSSTFTWFY